MSTKTLVISAVNITEGGPLTVLQDCVAAAPKALPGWDVVVLAHRTGLVSTPGVRVLEFPEIKRRWMNRIWAEWVRFKPLSRQLKADLWLSLHDMTPRVEARRQAVYCHNPSPFSRPTWRDAWFSPSYFAFALFYGLLYRSFIRRNHDVIVQQAWLRERFEQDYGVKRVIVAHPQPAISNLTVVAKPPHAGAPIFLFPAWPRSFKNFELIGAALQRLETDPAWRGRVRWTLDGSENRYAKWLKHRFGKLRSLEWIGRQTREQMQQQYLDADCLLFPSRVETWGLPVTEAKRHGLPVLAADLEYAHETVGNCEAADFFDPYDPTALAVKMLAFAQGHATTHPVAHPEPAQPFVSDWEQLLKALTAGL
jgi:glycosyltransferase involved in cell wall biosynthesis